MDLSKVKIETKRLILRPFLASDLEDFYAYAKLEGVGEMAGWNHHKSLDETKEVLDKFIEYGDVVAIFHKEDARVIGSLGIHDDKEKGSHLGYCLSKEYWGQGIMPEAGEALLNEFFNKLGGEAISCGYFNINERSRRVSEKLGFSNPIDTEFNTKSFGKIWGKNTFLKKEEFNQRKERG